MCECVSRDASRDAGLACIGTTLAGVADDRFLISLPDGEKYLLVRSFLGLYRTAKWSVTGQLEGQHPEPLVTGTVKTAAGCLATAFWENFQPSPLHILGSQNQLPAFKVLFKAFENVDPPTKRQKAITPRLLRKLLLKASHHSSLLDTATVVVADLVIGAFFFAMHSCEYSKPATPGKTNALTSMA
jgi:hypothetical protein